LATDRSQIHAKEDLQALGLAALLLDVGGWRTAGDNQTFLDPLSASADFIEQQTGRADAAGLARDYFLAGTRAGAALWAADRMLLAGQRKTEGGGSQRLALQSLFGSNQVLLPLACTRAARGHVGSEYNPVAARELTAEEAGISWRAFADDVAEAVNALGGPLADPGLWLELLREHGSRIAAGLGWPGGGFDPAVSLFDLARLRAALAQALYSGGLAPEAMLAAVKGQGRPFSMIAGDLSGLQSFLYRGQSDRAIRALKGRSFYLQHLSEHLARRVCRELGWTPLAEVLCGGGRFYLVGPAGPDLDPVRRAIEKDLLQAFAGELTLSLGSAEFGAKALATSGGMAGTLFIEVNQDLERRKHNRFAALATANDSGAGYEAVFGAYGQGGQCGTCGRDQKEFTASCPYCDYFIELGSQLRKASFLIEHEPPRRPELRALGVEVVAVESLSSGDEKEIAGANRVVGLNSFSVDGLVKAARKTANSYAQIGTRLQAVATPFDPKDETVVPFEMIARSSPRGEKNRLMVVRADVDNLGKLFSDQVNLAHLVCLSRTITDYFAGRVTGLLADMADKKQIYLVYAGGDDLFLVGAWEPAIDAAHQVAEQFDAFTNKQHHVSAGLALVRIKYPLSKAAELAGAAEHQAKAMENAEGKQTKNAVALLEVRVIADKVADRVKGGEARGLVRRLWEVWFAYQEQRQRLMRNLPHLAEKKNRSALDAQARWQRWRWLLVYSLRQELKSSEGVDSLEKAIFTPGNELYLGVVARLAELATRSEK
jgi:CRISPR-associated protein Csm1